MLRVDDKRIYNNIKPYWDFSYNECFMVHVSSHLKQIISKDELYNVFKVLFNSAKKNVRECTIDTVRDSRGLSLLCELKSSYKVIVRGYCRGGLASFVSDRTFAKIPFLPIDNTRPFWEFAITQYLHKKGVLVPELVGVCVQFCFSNLFYKGALFSVYVEGSSNFLVNVNNLNEVDRQFYAFNAGQEAFKMLSAGVFHRDLHPGNVLCVNKSKSVVLIDFDKAVLFGGDNVNYLSYFRKRLISRWNRSCEKHRLSKTIKESFKLGLFSDFV